MRRFVVEDRTAGEVVMEGRISGAGGVIVSSATRALNAEQVQAIVTAIGRDVAAGNSRGKLTGGNLDWVEVAPQ